MKKSELIFNLVSIPVDAISLALAGIVSFNLRKHFLEVVGPIMYRLDLNEFLVLMYKIIPALILIFALLGLYNLKGTRKFIKEFGKILIGTSLGLLLVILLFFFNQSIFPSRFIILATWGLGIVMVVLGRVILKIIQAQLFKKGIGLHRVVMISGPSQDALVLEEVFKNKVHGYQVVADFEYDDKLIDILEEYQSQNKIDEIMQGNPLLKESDNLKLVQFARNKGLKFSFVPNLFEVQRNIIETDQLNGVPIISLKNTPLDGWGKVSKRLVDILASLICLIITSPIFLLILFAIKIDSKGKFIYSALRGGCGNNFKFYKFRTMYSHLSVGEEYGGQEAEKIRQELWQKNDRGGKDGPFLKIKHDPRVTKVGRFLRRSKLDEIPQFWNVLIGDMSMVGPRAHVLDEVERYRSRYYRMFSVKPGIFGLSQTAQMNWADLPFEEEIRLNTFYIENWSLWLDIKILAESFWLLFFVKKNKEDY
jgi:exopolysaccharide biosynthesis polyprenyl glycosylphosphotransferase